MVADVSVVAGGRCAPGGSAGILTVEGSYQQSATAKLQIEIGGPEAGAEYDQLTVIGPATLGGMLEIELIDEFLPDADDTFTILDADVLNGSFFNAVPGQRLMTVDGVGSFLVQYGASSPFPSSSVVLSEFQAIPEPAAAIWAMCASLIWASRRRREAH